MRKRDECNGVSLHVIAGTYVVLLGMNATSTARGGLLGFAIHRTDHTENDENMLVIQDDTRLADIYLGEFARLFNHFYFRYIANLLRTDEASPDRSHAFLKPDDSWTEKYYQPGSIKEKQRLLFA